MHEWFYDSIALFVVLISFYFLFHKKIRTSETWHATVTPLASIIGSGFLVSAPLLLYSTGRFAVFVMVLIVILAYGIGDSIRFNIRYVEPELNQKKKNKALQWVEDLSRPALGIAYLISVTFYLKLLSSFAMRGIGVTDDYWKNWLTTVILLFIGIVGRIQGLSMLEIIETYSVNTKLSIIFALIICFSLFNGELLWDGNWVIIATPHESFWQGLCKVLGMLIIVQGFETSRYIGEAHSAPMRIRTMKYAQWLSGVIYIVFVGLATAIFYDIRHMDETAVIDLSRVVASFLPYLLIIAAIMSQFSAAVSDTLGGGGLLSETLGDKYNSKQCYLAMALGGIGLTWLTDIYQIISIASKAFAFYYALQILLSLICLKTCQGSSQFPFSKYLLYSFLLLLMIMVLFFGTPVA